MERSEHVATITIKVNEESTTLQMSGIAPAMCIGTLLLVKSILSNTEDISEELKDKIVIELEKIINKRRA